MVNPSGGSNDGALKRAALVIDRVANLGRQAFNVLRVVTILAVHSAEARRAPA
jgi:hypothetical protein